MGDMSDVQIEFGPFEKKSEPVANQPANNVTPLINLEPPARAPRVTPADTSKQISLTTGAALPGTTAAADFSEYGPLSYHEPLPHPATQRVYDNLELTKDMDPTEEDKFKAISQAAKIPVELARNIHPSMIKNWMERQDVQMYLEQANATRKRMAIDIEAALVLQGSIKPLAASEQAIARLGHQVLLDFKDPTQPLRQTEGERSVAEGFGRAILQSLITFGKTAPLERAREGVIQKYTDVDRDFGEVVGDWYERTKPRFTADLPHLPTPGEVWDLSRRLISWMTNSPEDKEAHLKEAMDISRQLVKVYERSRGKSSRYAQNFWDRVAALDPEMSEADKAYAMYGIIQDMPGEATVAMTEVVLQQSVPLVGGALMTFVTKNPSAGMLVTLGGGYVQERFNDYNADLMKKYGKSADLRTEAGMKAFINSPERQDHVRGIGEDRAIAISLANLFGFKIVQKKLAQNVVANLALQLPTQASIEAAGEAAAGWTSGQGFDSVEIILEGLGGFGTAPVDMYIAVGEKRQEFKSAKDAKAWLETGKEVSSKIKEIEPHALATAAEVMADRLRDEGVTTVYLSAEQLHKFDQDLPTGETATETLGLDAETVRQAAEDGRDVEIGVDAYVRHILGKEGFAALVKHTRFTLEGMTPDEATEFDTTGELSVEEQLTSAVQERLEKSLGVTVEESLVLREDAEAIAADVRTQLESIKGMSSREVALNSLLTARRYVARAARATKATGQEVRALDLYLEDNLTVTDQQVEQVAPDAPVVLTAGAVFTPTDGSGLVGHTVTEADGTSTRTIKLIEPKEAIPRSEFDSDEAFEKFEALRADINAQRERGMATLKKLRSAQEVDVEQAAAFQQLDQNRLVEVVEDGQVVPKLPDGSDPRKLFRVMSRAEFEAGVEQGSFAPGQEGRTHVSVQPQFQFAEPGADNVLVEITFDKADGFRAKVAGDEVVAITDQAIPSERVRLVAQGDRAALEASFSRRDALDQDILTPPDTEIKGSTEGEIDDKRWRALKPTKTKAGKFVGTPEWVKNAGGLTRLRKLLRNLTEEGLPGRFWYEDSALEALRISNGDYTQAERFIGLLAIYSPQTGVFPNTGFAIKAYTQWKNGDPVDVKTGDQDVKAQAWLDSGKDWGGRKVNSFYLNLMKELLTSADQETLTALAIPDDVVSEIDRATVDLWVLRAMGYELDSAGASVGLAGKYSFSENEIRRLAGVLNDELQPGERRWLPHQVQAALWTAIKGRYEVPSVKKATIAESVKKGYSKYDEETGKWTAPKKNTPNKRKHMMIWRKHALAANDADVQKSVEIAKGSFGTMLNRIAQNITWEAVPSADLNLDITSADPAVRQQFTEEAISLLVDDTGHDLLADQLGVPLNLAELGTGGYAGDINANAITTLIPIKPAGRFDNQTALNYARAIQYIFKQDAVPLFRAESKINFTKDYSVKTSWKVTDGEATRTFPTQAEAEADVEAQSNPDEWKVTGGKAVRAFPTQAQAEADLAARRAKLEGSVKKDGTLKAGVQEKLDDLNNWTVGGGPLARGVRISFASPLDGQAEATFFQMLRKHLGSDAGYSKINGDIIVINFRDDDAGLPFVSDEVFAAGLEALEEDDGKTLGISKLEPFGSEGQYGPVHDWAADPEGAPVAEAIDTSGRPDLQSWVRDRRAAFEAVIERYSGEELAARQEELSLHQDTPQGKARGSFTPASQITDQNGQPMNLLQVFEQGDRSTFLHESGHFWLEQLKSDADRFGEDFQKDWGTVKKWWGQNADSIRAEAVDRAKRAGDKEFAAEIAAMSDAAIKKYINSGELTGTDATRYLSVAMHEQFARGTENYFKTGNAPSIALADAFVAFAVWIRSVYRSIQRLTGRDGFDVQFSPEVTALMDRMIATDIEIEIAASQYELASMFDTAAEAGMTQKKFAEHNEEQQQHKEKAKIQHLAKRVKEMERERLDWWKEEREEMRGEVEHDVARLPAYRLLWSLTEGGLADGSTATASEKVNRMDRDALKEVTDVTTLPKVGGKTIFQAPSKKNPGETTSPGMVANLYGYNDVQEMVDDLNATVGYAEAVEAEMTARMEVLHGSIDDGAVDVAIASIHEEDGVAKHMAAELAALRTTEEAINPKFVKAYAENLINQQKMGEANPRSYLAAEKRHAKAAGRALKKGDRQEAYKHQFQRLTNHYLAAEATKQKAVTQKQLAYMRQFKSKRKKFPTIEAEYVDQIKAKVGIHDFSARVSDKRRMQIEQDAFAEFLADKENDGTATFDIPEWLKQKDRLVHFRDLTIGEFRDLHDTIKQLEKQGKNAKKVRLGDADVERDVVVARMITALAGEGVAAAVKEEGAEAGGKFGPAQLLAFADAAMLKIEFLLEEIDGQPLGVWHQALYQPFADAEAAKQDLNVEVANLIREKIDALPKQVKQDMGKRVDVGALAGTSNNPKEIWTRGNLIMLAMNVGNASNLDKVIRGERSIGREIDEGLIDAALENLTEEEWNFIRSIWAHSEKLWPTVEKIYRDEYGRAPDRVEPREVHTQFGTFEGGYFPLIYNTKRSTKGKNIENMNTLEAFSSQQVRATVNSSMTKERVQEFTAPIDFNIQKLVSGFDRTIHFMTHYGAVKNANRILGHPELKEAMMVKLGPEYVNSLTAWIGSIASNGQDAPANGFLETGVAWFARNTTVAVLGASYSTLLAQILGYSTAIDRLMVDTGTYGTSLPMVVKDLGIAWGQVFSKEHREAIYEMSGEMRHRLNNTDRDLRAGLREVRGEKGIRARVAEYSMLTIAAMQLYTVDIPVWTAAYNRSLRNEGDTDIAVKYADRVVRISQSAGGLKDLAAIQRGKGAVKAFTLFYSFFSVMYAILRSIGHEVVLKNPTSIPRMLARLTVVLVLNELGYGLLRGEVPDLDPDDEDEDGALKWLAKKTISGAAGTVPFGRDIIEGMIDDYGYDISPTAMFGEAVAESFTTAAKALDFWFNSDTEEEPPELKDIKPLVLALGILLKQPVIQINRTLSGMFALYEDEEEADFFDLLVGYKEPED